MRPQRCRVSLYCLTTNQLAHDQITTEPVSIVDVRISGQTRVNRLPRQPDKSVPPILAGAVIGQQISCEVSQAERLIQFTK